MKEMSMLEALKIIKLEQMYKNLSWLNNAVSYGFISDTEFIADEIYHPDMTDFQIIVITRFYKVIYKNNIVYENLLYHTVSNNNTDKKDDRKDFIINFMRNLYINEIKDIPYDFHIVVVISKLLRKLDRIAPDIVIDFYHEISQFVDAFDVRTYIDITFKEPACKRLKDPYIESRVFAKLYPNDEFNPNINIYYLFINDKNITSTILIELLSKGLYLGDVDLDKTKRTAVFYEDLYRTQLLNSLNNNEGGLIQNRGYERMGDIDE